MHRHPAAGALLFVSLLILVAPIAAQQDQDPLELDLEERVEVPYTLLDVVVVNRDGATVPGLTGDEFRLFIDGRPVPIETVDTLCPDGSLEDADPGEPSGWSIPDSGGALQQRILIVLDYFHLNTRSDALDQARDLIDERFVEGVDHAIVTLSEGIRIETPWTRDPAVLRQTIERMRDDPTLYAGQFGTLSEFPVWRRLLSLMDLMETIPGRKAIVLFTGPFRPRGWTFDPWFEELAGLASATRTSIYPVNTRGVDNFGPTFPPILARMAATTGGRMTSNTNDLSLGYARAHRDIACRYTLGFRPPEARSSRARRVKIEVEGKGYVVNHPDRLIERSEETRRRALLRTASLAPALFEAGELRLAAELSPSARGNRSDVTLALRFPAPEGDEVGEWWWRGVVRSPGGTVIRKFGRLKPDRANEDRETADWSEWDPGEGVENAISAEAERVGDAFVERFRLRPGQYEISVAASLPGQPRPYTATLQLDVPKRGPGAEVATPSP